MSLRINLNAASLTAYRNLLGTDGALGKSIERLSSGFKINTAGDDPAGLVISEKLRAQMSGLAQAIKNAGDAVNMAKTAEGALSEVHRLIRSMRDLAVHAANAGANDSAAITADQAQITNALASINKMADETQFGSKKLLDGSAGIRTTILGNAAAPQVTGANLNATTTLAATDTISITTTQAATRGAITTLAWAANDTTVLAAAKSMTINGKVYNFTTSDTATTIVAAINADTATTGVTAALSGSNNGITTITSVNYGSDTILALTAVSSGVLTGNATSAAAAGLNVKATVTHSGGATGNVSDATWQSGTGATLTDTLGNQIFLTTAAASQTAGALTTTIDTVKGSLTFQVGAYAGQTREISIGSTGTDYLGLGGSTTVTNLTDIDVTTATGATEALKVLDKAISDVSTSRANLGASQKNVFESSISSLTVARENIAASESSIRDTDMASEMVEFTKYQILAQAGVAMLAQANSAPQTLLTLLR